MSCGTVVGAGERGDYNVDDYYSDDVNVVVTYHQPYGSAFRHRMTTERKKK